MHKVVYDVIRAYHAGEDGLGSYTGTAEEGGEPEQDADDL